MKPSVKITPFWTEFTHTHTQKTKFEISARAKNLASAVDQRAEVTHTHTVAHT